MTDQALEGDVLDELGPDRIQEIADILGTDTAGAIEVIRTSLAYVSSAFGRTATTGDRTKALTHPAAESVVHKTGLPDEAVVAAMERLVPIMLTVLDRRGSA
ncbi:DUF937 domain-containing protein [Streptomyces gobiensis]|uniref:DUF937 domain-containing protein n=1 Tax=Streptomyces gobiensis TaxID=2875706 RepID=UPI001E4F7051|nr:DUF937 domain-containing protein [Streptomyces gobiensis]UGY91529.1 DUF937 domain-containing protein [Streptomyces gobiensis]